MNNDIHQKFKCHFKDMLTKTKEIDPLDLVGEATKAIPFTQDNAINGFIKDTKVHQLKQTVTQINFILLGVMGIIAEELPRETFTLNDLTLMINELLSHSNTTDIKDITNLGSNKIKRKMHKIVLLIMAEYKEFTKQSNDFKPFLKNMFFKMIDIESPNDITLDDIIARFEAPAIQIKNNSKNTK